MMEDDPVPETCGFSEAYWPLVDPEFFGAFGTQPSG
jgi:hypothetical protein